MEHLASTFNLVTGDTVEVTISQHTDVRLFDANNYQRHVTGQSCRAVGGGFAAGLVRLAAPHSGRFYLVLDLGGRAGTIRHSDVVARHRAA